jgi:pyridoxal phosphate enzyme (YggS family)
VAAVQERIAQACARVGRPVSEVTLVGASKRQPVSKLLAAWEAGVRVFGENRVQEAAEKKPELPPEIEWHLLGPLQSNKARQALELFQVIHSLDRPKIARTLSRVAGEMGRVAECFVEINLGGEESKHGFPPQGLVAALEPLAGLPHLRFLGLMAIPPPGAEAESSRPWFIQLRELRDEVAGSGLFPDFPGWLSMGMSDDFEVAIEEGATHVRVGTSLFGRRDS